MESVTFGSQNYTSKYKNGEQPHEETMTVHTNKTPKDSFNKKYRKKNKVNTGVLATIALMAVSAFAAYKGKDKISGIISGIKTQSGAAKSGFKTKFPNMSESFSYFKKACQTPINKAKKILK